MTVADAVSLINQIFAEPYAGLLSGILFGVKTNISKELHDALITTGTLHLVALSGQNISILVGFVSVLLLRIARRPIANILSIGAICWFIWFVGPSPSVVRAGVMGSLTLLGISFGRQIWPLMIWILAVLGMLLLHPLWVADLSFQLSAMATLGILLFAKHSSGLPDQAKNTKDDTLGLNNLLSNMRSLLLADLRVTLSAQVFTIPIIMFAFERISLVSPLTNMLVGWLVAPIMIGGFVVVLTGFIYLPLAHVIGWVVWVPLMSMIHIIELTARIPFASIGL
jgi:competence protein ComEC